jgi:hypothetical protein
MRDYEEGLADGRACLEAALRYLALGWSVIPLCPPDHVGVGKEHGRNCKSKGKAPLVPWAAFQKRYATEDEVREWWKHWPNANVGVVLGTISGMIGLDIDGPAGEAALASLAGNELPQTLEFVTPGGGRRLLYLCSDETEIRPFQLSGGNKQEVRLLGDGSQTVAPPSRHVSGGYYQWSIAP